MNEDKPAMSTNVHDPLCPRPICDYGERDGDCTGYEDCQHDCQCSLIAKVRADEREQAAERLKARDLHEEWCPLGLPKWMVVDEACQCDHARCIAAARGEAS